VPQLELDDTTLHYEDTGTGSTGDTIAFSHGLLWSTELFAPQIAALRARYRCIAWDHRGQGKSAADHRHCIGIELVSRDAIALLERLAPGPVHFVGLSMGGFVAMRVAARRPELVRSLALLETSADPEPIENVAKYRLLSALSRAFGPRPLRGRIAPIMFGQAIQRDRARRAELAGYVEVMMRRRDAWRAVNGVIDRAGIRDELDRVRAPTLVVVGDEDVATPAVRAERIVSAIAGSRLVRIPGAGHSSPVEQPAAVTEALASFIARS
jgi:3-oxoadipate enol-lactonase